MPRYLTTERCVHCYRDRVPEQLKAVIEQHLTSALRTRRYFAGGQPRSRSPPAERDALRRRPRAFRLGSWANGLQNKAYDEDLATFFGVSPPAPSTCPGTGPEGLPAAHLQIQRPTRSPQLFAARLIADCPLAKELPEAMRRSLEQLAAQPEAAAARCKPPLPNPVKSSLPLKSLYPLSVPRTRPCGYAPGRGVLGPSAGRATARRLTAQA